MPPQAASDVAKNTYESSLHEIERAQAGSSQARDQLSKTTVYSPIDGTVTILNSKFGERIVATGQFAGTEVMRVADLNHMEARVDVNENDVVNVKVGDKANIKIDAYGDRKFHGTVYQIANTGKTTGAGTQEEVTNFRGKDSYRRSRCDVEAGLSCTADIETNMVKDVVAVPMQSGHDPHRRQQFEPGRDRKEKAKRGRARQRRQQRRVHERTAGKGGAKRGARKTCQGCVSEKRRQSPVGEGYDRNLGRHLHGDQERHSTGRRSNFGQLQRDQSQIERRRQGFIRQGSHKSRSDDLSDGNARFHEANRSGRDRHREHHEGLRDGRRDCARPARSVAANSRERIHRDYGPERQRQIDAHCGARRATGCTRPPAPPVW